VEKERQLIPSTEESVWEGRKTRLLIPSTEENV
ncbi:hypothetical protein J2S17_005741, partial [Cytobacillus purgationiresistens]|nr:hypothetical protein [Cytobacillus purgationiresistens]